MGLIKKIIWETESIIVEHWLNNSEVRVFDDHKTLIATFVAWDGGIFAPLSKRSDYPPFSSVLDIVEYFTGYSKSEL